MPTYDPNQRAERLQRINETKDTLIKVQAQAIEHVTQEACTYYQMIATIRTRLSQIGDLRMVGYIDKMLDEMKEPPGGTNEPKQ